MEIRATRGHFEFENQEKIVRLCLNTALVVVIKKGVAK